MTGFLSFLWLNNIPLYVYYIFFLHLSVNGHLGYFQLLVIVNDMAMNTRVQIYRDLYFNYFEWKPEVRLLHHMVVVFLIFGGTFILFPISTTPFYIKTVSSLTLAIFFFIMGIMTGVRQYFLVVLHFPDFYLCWTSFHIPVFNLYVFSGEMCIQAF